MRPLNPHGKEILEEKTGNLLTPIMLLGIILMGGLTVSKANPKGKINHLEIRSETLECVSSLGEPTEGIIIIGPI